MHLIIGLANIHSLSAYGAMMLECFATILINSQKLLNFKIIFTIFTIIKQINSINLSKTEPFDSPVEATEKSTIGSLLARVGRLLGSERAIGEVTNLTEFSIMEMARRVVSAAAYRGTRILLRERCHASRNGEGRGGFRSMSSLAFFPALNSREVLRVPKVLKVVRSRRCLFQRRAVQRLQSSAPVISVLSCPSNGILTSHFPVN